MPLLYKVSPTLHYRSCDQTCALRKMANPGPVGNSAIAQAFSTLADVLTSQQPASLTPQAQPPRNQLPNLTPRNRGVR